MRAALADVERRHEELQRALHETVLLAETEQHRVQALLDRLPTAVVEFDAPQRCSWADRAFLDLVGRDLPEVLGRGWHAALHPGDLAEVLGDPLDVRERRTARFVRPDGREVACDVALRRGAGGRPGRGRPPRAVVQLVDGRRTGYEALVRWNHPARGLLLPGEFLDVAEESGVSRRIDTVVLREAVGFLSRHPGTTVAVNVSRRRLDGSFAESVLLQLARSGVETHRSSIELLETSLLTIDSTTTRELRTSSAAGCEILIDDFGTGCSVLSHLRRSPVTGLKLDRSFVADLPHDENADRIAAAVAGLASGFGMQRIAEGVESAEQAVHLRAQGWTAAQGWFSGRPAPEEVRYPAAVRVALAS